MTEPRSQTAETDCLSAGAPWSRSNVWVVSLVASGLLYGLTMTPGLSWGDSGEAQLHVLLGGWYLGGEIVRSHVLYFALSRALTILFPAAMAANVVAAAAGAVTVANLSWLITSQVRSKVALLCGVSVLLLSHTLWQLSTAAEVVTLSTALLSLELMAFVKLVESRKLRFLALMMLVSGLGVSNHNFALLMWPVYGALAFRFRGDCANVRFKAALIGGGCLLVGMVPVLLLCLDDFLQRGSLAGTAQSLLVGHFGTNVTNLGRLPGLLMNSILIALLNFPTPLIILVPIGAYAVARRASAPLRWMFIGAASIFALFGARYDVPDQHVFLVPAFLFVAFFLAVGVDHLVTYRPSVTNSVMLVACALMGPVAYAIAPPLLRTYAADRVPLPAREVPYRDRFDYFLRPWRNGYGGPERFARETFETLPQDAWLVVDSTLFAPLNYLQVSEAMRRDVRLDCVLARQDWLGPLGPDADLQRQTKLEAGLLFSASDQIDYLPDWLRSRPYRFERRGPIFQVVLP